MFRRTLFLLVVTAAILSGCTAGDDQSGAAVKGAPDFTLHDLQGNAVRLSDYRGKVVLLEFWATWCPPCRASIPAIEQLHKTYKNKGLVVLAISLDYGGWEEVKAFTQYYGISYTVLKGTDDIAVKYKARTIPMMVLVDKKGDIKGRLIGSGVEEEIEKDIRALL